MNTIFWAGDSTVQYNSYETYPQIGIGQVFPLFLKEEYKVENYAKNGRSTKSFLEEGRLAEIESNLEENDFLFIQFGHNDEKIDDASRYTNPSTDFVKNLEKFIIVAKNKNAYPILITPLERRCFCDEKNLEAGEHAEYVAAIKCTAEKNKVPLIDLYHRSREELQRVGELDSRKWYMYFGANIYSKYPEGMQDNTHLRFEGAVLFSEIIAMEMKSLGGIYSKPIIQDN